MNTLARQRSATMNAVRVKDHVCRPTAVFKKIVENVNHS